MLERHHAWLACHDAMPLLPCCVGAVVTACCVLFFLVLCVLRVLRVLCVLCALCALCGFLVWVSWCLFMMWGGVGAAFFTHTMLWLTVANVNVLQGVFGSPDAAAAACYALGHVAALLPDSDATRIRAAATALARQVQHRDASGSPASASPSSPPSPSPSPATSTSTSVSASTSSSSFVRGNTRGVGGVGGTVPSAAALALAAMAQQLASPSSVAAAASCASVSQWFGGALRESPAPVPGGAGGATLHASPAHAVAHSLAATLSAVPQGAGDGVVIALALGRLCGVLVADHGGGIAAAAAGGEATAAGQACAAWSRMLLEGDSDTVAKLVGAALTTKAAVRCGTMDAVSVAPIVQRLYDMAMHGATAHDRTAALLALPVVMHEVQVCMRVHVHVTRVCWCQSCTACTLVLWVLVFGHDVTV